MSDCRDHILMAALPTAIASADRAFFRPRLAHDHTAFTAGPDIHELAHVVQRGRAPALRPEGAG